MSGPVSDVPGFHYPGWVHELVERWRSLLIPNWTVKLMPDAYDAAAESENSGEAQTDVRYRRIRMWIKFQGRSRDAVEQTIVHELLHAHFNAVKEALEPGVERLGFTERTIVNAAVKHAEEGAIERLANVLVALAHGAEVESVSEGPPGHHVGDEAA